MKLPVLLLFLLSSVSVHSTIFTTPVDSFMNYLVRNKAFSGSVRVQKYDKVIYQYSHTLPGNNTERYRIGSVSKVFTAVIILQLIEEGKLTWLSKLSTYYPGIPNADNITVGQLLTHSSGIYNITDLDEYYAIRTKSFTPDEIIGILKSKKPEFTPGTDISYSNSNYILLGFIISKITGKSYSEEVKQRICIPLDLLDTYVETDIQQAVQRESSYKFNGNEWIKDIDSHPSLPGAAGAIVSTTADLCVFTKALFFNKLVNDSSLFRMKKIRAKNIGAGLFYAPFYDTKGWGHSGRIDEYRAFITCFPQDSILVAVTTNGLRIKLNDVILGVLSILYNKKSDWPDFKECTVRSPSVDIFSGKYEARVGGMIPSDRFYISKASDNHLYMMESKGNFESEKSLLERTSEKTFYSRDSGGELVFRLNKKGQPVSVVLIQGKMKINCKRIGGSES